MRDPIPLSPLGFGCAPVMGKVSKAHALRAMAQAFDLGVTHFDVARSYGFGRAESVLGAFIKGRRDQVTVTTKFGVVAPELSLKTRLLIPVARQVTQFLPHLKARLKSKSGQMLAERNFDVAYARKCLDRSLQELGTDYIDIYLVHEPAQTQAFDADGLRELMEDSVRAGKIRRWGYALRTPADYGWVATFGGDIIQFEGNIETLSKCSAILNDGRQRIVTRPFFGGMVERHSLANVIAELDLSRELDEIAASLSDVALCLSRQMAKASGAVLTSMFSPTHIEVNIRTINVWTDNERMTSIVDKLNSSLKMRKVE